jgi:hypothetical protein
LGTLRIDTEPPYALLGNTLSLAPTFQAAILKMKSATRLLVGADALVVASCVNGLAEEVFAAIDKQDDGLKTLNKEVISPMADAEAHAHKTLTDFLEDQDFNVTRSAYNLSTAFCAEYCNGEGRAVLSTLNSMRFLALDILADTT